MYYTLEKALDQTLRPEEGFKKVESKGDKDHQPAKDQQADPQAAVAQDQSGVRQTLPLDLSIAFGDLAAGHVARDDGDDGAEKGHQGPSRDPGDETDDRQGAVMFVCGVGAVIQFLVSLL